MKNRQLPFLLATLLVATRVSAADREAAPPFPVVWTLTEGLQAPESAYVDPVSGSLFLSQIGAGGGKAKDGDGWISKLTVDGKMVVNKWVTGLSAPKGLRSHGDILWVSDIDRLVGVSIKEAKVVHNIAIDGAKFLNDVATGPDGTVYISDMAASRVYAHKDGQITVFADGPELEHPNGLLVHDGKLYLGGWGQNLKDDFSTDPVGRLLYIGMKTRMITAVTLGPTGNLDGIEADGSGGFVVTDWRAGKVFHISKTGKSRELMTLTRGTADHAFLPDKKLLILPRMLDNTLTAYDLTSAFAESSRRGKKKKK